MDGRVAPSGIAPAPVASRSLATSCAAGASAPSASNATPVSLKLMRAGMRAMVVPRTDAANGDQLESLPPPRREGGGGGARVASHEEPENIQVEVEREEAAPEQPPARTKRHPNTCPE